MAYVSSTLRNPVGIANQNSLVDLRSQLTDFKHHGFGDVLEQVLIGAMAFFVLNVASK